MMPNQELIGELALLGIVFLATMAIVYGFAIGYLAGRPTRTERKLLHRALLAYPPSQDPIIAKKERRLLKDLEVVE